MDALLPNVSPTSSTAAPAAALPAVARKPKKAAKRPRKPGFETLPGGGLLVIAGPPCEGKGPLASRLEDTLPHALRFEAVDNLSRSNPVWYPEGREGRAVSRPETPMLEAACARWRAGKKRPPTILVVSRFGTRRARQNAAAVAGSAGVPFLLVEARSGTIRALRRTSKLTLDPDAAVKRMQRYDREKDAYQPVAADELTGLPALSLKGVLSDLDAATERVIRAWRGV